MKFSEFTKVEEKAEEEKSNEGTYVAVRFSDETNANLKKYAEGMGLTPIDDFHLTVCYSEKRLDIDYKEQEVIGLFKPEKLMYLGDNEYRAIVIKGFSNIVKERHEYYKKEHGYVHTYPEFIQHISLAYQPPEDIDLKDIPLPDFEIQIVSERSEKLN